MVLFYSSAAVSCTNLLLLLLLLLVQVCYSVVCCCLYEFVACTILPTIYCLSHTIYPNPIAACRVCYCCYYYSMLPGITYCPVIQTTLVPCRGLLPQVFCVYCNRLLYAVTRRWLYEFVAAIVVVATTTTTTTTTTTIVLTVLRYCWLVSICWSVIKVWLLSSYLL